MKTTFTFLLLLIALTMSAQTPAERQPDGGGEHVIEPGPCLTPDDYARIETQLATDLEQLRATGQLPAVNDRSVVNFAWPLQPTAACTFNNYYGIANYVDQNTTAGIQDYDCGTRTYNGHNGLDISSWPFAWYLMENNLIEVIAAAEGTIISKADGFADDHCSCVGSWNAVYVQHADGSVAWYGHLKKGSVTAKAIGETVSQGEVLGVVASSGCSTAPHLHFEVYQALPYQRINLIETFQGSCNSLNNQTWWAAQQAYREPTLNVIATHSAPPVFGCTAAEETPSFSNTFAPGATAHFGTYYRDQLQNQTTTFRLLKPDGSVWKTWNHTSPSTYSFSWWYFSWTLPAVNAVGTWKYEATYNGQTFVHEFTVATASAVESAATEKQFVLSPNPTSGQISLSGPVERIENIRVFDGQGRMIQRIPGASAQLPIDLSARPAGVYFLEILYDGRIERARIVRE